MMYKMGPCQINQPRKIKPAKRFLFIPGADSEICFCSNACACVSQAICRDDWEGKEEAAENREG